MRTTALALLMILLAASSSAQQLSSDGRSVVGRTTMLDRLVRFLDPDRLLIGLSGDELKLWGERLYPQEGILHNRAGHRLGSRILTDRFGPVAATALGIANEIFEAYNLRHIGAPVISTERFDLEDLAANFRGVYDSYAMDLNTPWGLVRLLRDRPGPGDLLCLAINSRTAGTSSRGTLTSA
ncbi:MAG: hypothetical protein LJF15_05315 [Acidobacteria bacterium]|nr:hypothetical protein [Acidobacteriota bacterium]